jgi:hypothetical protein
MSDAGEFRHVDGISFHDFWFDSAGTHSVVTEQDGCVVRVRVDGREVSATTYAKPPSSGEVFKYHQAALGQEAT